MKRQVINFIKKILIAIALLSIVGFIIFVLLLPDKYLTVLPWMMGFFAIITILSYIFQIKPASKDMAKFTRVSMIISLVRLALYSLFAIIYISQRPDNAAVFVVSIVIVYVIFTSMEISDLSVRIKKNRTNNN
jgi:hypothetical protein